MVGPHAWLAPCQHARRRHRPRELSHDGAAGAAVFGPGVLCRGGGGPRRDGCGAGAAVGYRVLYRFAPPPRPVKLPFSAGHPLTRIQWSQCPAKAGQEHQKPVVCPLARALITPRPCQCLMQSRSLGVHCFCSPSPCFVCVCARAYPRRPSPSVIHGRGFPIRPGGGQAESEDDAKLILPPTRCLLREAPKECRENHHVGAYALCITATRKVDGHPGWMGQRCISGSGTLLHPGKSPSPATTALQFGLRNFEPFWGKIT